MNRSSAKITALRTMTVIFLLMTPFAYSDSSTRSGQDPQLYVTLGTGLPNVATAGAVFCPDASYYLQIGGGSFLLESGAWTADISGGWVFHDFGGVKNSMLLTGIGYSIYYLNNFFLSSESSANPKFETHNFVTLSCDYIKFFQPQGRLAWTAGISLNGSTSAFLPELRVGLVLQAF
jgi:hypothetical protein